MSNAAPSQASARAACPGGHGADHYTPDTYKPDDSVAYLMRRLMTGFVGQVEHELEPSGLTNAQWVPLYKLYLGHCSTAAEIARACQLDAGAVTRMLDRLEAKDLVRRVRSSEDRRVVKLELTDEGRRAAGEIPQTLCKVLNAHLRGFSVEEVALLRSLLLRMLDNGAALEQEREIP
jgi:DNA-binding MarR family transcriptional regulator